MKKKRLVIEIISAVIVLAIISIVIVFFIFSTRDEERSDSQRIKNNDIDRYIQIVYEDDSFISKDEINFIKHDNKLPVGNYVDYELSILEYGDNAYYNKGGVLRDLYLGEKIQSEKKIYDKSGEVELELYSIKGVSTEVAVGVCGKNSEIKNLFLNDSYKADNMMELMEDCGFFHGAIVEYCSLSDYNGKHSIWYQGITMDELRDMLFEDSELMLAKDFDSRVEETGMSFRIYVSSFDCYFWIRILENGDLRVDSMDLYNSWVFSNENGIEKGVEFINYIRINYKGAFL